MLGFRLNPPGPFWFEDLMFLVVDEARRLPGRAKHAMAVARQMAETIAATDPTEWVRRKPRPTDTAQPATTTLRQQDVVPLDEPEEWTLATEPLVAAEAGAKAAAALHRAAADQLDALTYALDRMRDELRPLMIYAPFKDDTVHQLRDAAALETNIEALLELSRRNAATRPKDRVRPAA